MGEKVSKGDFIEIDFIARIKGSNRIFDLTKEDIAKKEGIYQKNRKYKPLIVCLGSGHLLKGLDNFLQGKEVGEELEVDIPPEDAFGKRNPRLIQLSTLKQFKEKGVTPVPGLQLVIDGALATVRSVSGGRVIIDFNHPLAGRTLHYWVKINRKVTDFKEKICAILNLIADIDCKDCKIEASEKEIKIALKNELPSQTIEVIKKQIKELISESKNKEIKIVKT